MGRGRDKPLDTSYAIIFCYLYYLDIGHVAVHRAVNENHDAVDEANEVAEQIKKEFPEIPVYTFFRSPRWLCRVGDYKSVEEADAVMRRLRNTGKFKEVSVVREQINIPLE